MTKAQLLEQRGDKLKAADALVTAAQNESRSMTSEEVTQFDALEAEAKAIGETVARMERTAGRQNVRQVSINQDGEAGEKKAIKKRFSFSKAFATIADGRQLDGLEDEMHQQARSEFSEIGLNVKGSFQTPALFMEKDEDVEAERRTITVGGDGGNIVPTDLGALIGILRPNLVLEQMGARVLTGLVGDIDMPNQATKAVGTWLAETGTATESNLTLAKRSLQPHRLATFSVFSRQLLNQGTPSIEGLVREDLAMAIRENVEYGAIQGSGTNPVPFGILNTTGIGNVALGTNGAAPTFESIIDLETAIANSDYNGLISYLTTPTMRGRLKQTQKFSGTNGSPVWDGNEMNGYSGFTTTQVPSDLTKGTNSDCHAIIAGDFSQLLMAQWGGTDFVIDPYTLADSGEIKITVGSYWDVFLRYVKAFAAIKDARNV
jgi:HK97 family phage major capsid protein